MADSMSPKKYAILETCYNINCKEGFEKITLKRIGKEMGIAPSLVMHYFKNKQELFENLVDFMVEKMMNVYMEEMNHLKTYEEKMVYYLDKTISLFIAQTVDDVVFYSCFYKGLIDDSIKQRFRKMYDKDYNLNKIIIQGYLDEKGITGRNVEYLSISLIAFWEGLNIYHAIYGDSEDFQNIAEYLKQIFLKILNEGLENNH